LKIGIDAAARKAQGRESREMCPRAAADVEQRARARHGSADERRDRRRFAYVVFAASGVHFVVKGRRLREHQACRFRAGRGEAARARP